MVVASGSGKACGFTPVLGNMTTETIALAADHGGFELKAIARDEVERAGLNALDLGTDGAESVDYPDYALMLVEAIKSGQANRGILVCGTGIGISIAANRHAGIRAALCYDDETARLAREHNDANVLVLGGRKTDEKTARSMIRIFLSTEFVGGRHARRVAKLG